MNTPLEQKDARAEAGFKEADEFLDVLKKEIRAPGDKAGREVENAISTLVREALQDQSIVSPDIEDTINRLMAKIDERLSAQVNEIIHHPEFQAVESAWRGLSYTVSNSETDSTLKIQVLNVSKAELAKDVTFELAKWDTRALFKKIYGEGVDKLGGEPVSVIIGDYYFDHSAADVNLLKGIGMIAEAAQAPFIASAAPSLMNLDSWNEVMNPRELGTIFDGPEYAAWRSLRDEPNSRFVGLTMPRVMARLPYGQNGVRTEDTGFAFEEETDGHAGKNYAWMNASHAMAVNINRAFKESGWTVQIRGVQSGGEVGSLPVHTFDAGDGTVEMKCPTEVAIGERREAELSKLGLLGLIHRKGTDKAAFLGAQSLYKPKSFVGNPDATASDNLSSRIPYIFAVSRFSHYLKVMVRDMIGSTKEGPQLERELQTWLNQYVHANPSVASEAEKAKYPLAAAKIEVFADEENPGYYMSKIFLRPHFQLEGMDIGMSLVSRLPQGKG